MLRLVALVLNTAGLALVLYGLFTGLPNPHDYAPTLVAAFGLALNLYLIGGSLFRAFVKQREEARHPVQVPSRLL